MSIAIKDNYSGISNWTVRPVKDDKVQKKYSEDDMIDAYLKGKREQANSEKQMQLEKLKDNINIVTDIAESLKQEISKNSFNCSDIRLRIKSIFRYSLIFVVNEDDFCNDNFLKIYEYSIDLKKEKNKSDTFDVNIIFTPENENFELDCLLADGYNLSYGDLQ